MLGDTDRARSVDLQQDDSSADNVNPPGVTAITHNPAAFAAAPEQKAAVMEPSAEQQSGSAVFAVFSEVLALGRMPKAAHQLVVVSFVLNGLGWFSVGPFLWGNFAGYTDPSALLWLSAALIGTGNLLFPLVVSSLRLAVAPAAGLEALGINEVQISDESIKSLKKWRVLLFQTALTFVGSAGLTAATPWLISPERYRDLCASIPLTGALGLHLWFGFALPVALLGMGLMVFHSWFLSMKLGAALSAPKVQRVIDAARRGRPATSPEDWHKDVTRPTLDLHGLMGQLTKVWGGGVGYFTVINWLFSIGMLCLILDPKVCPGFEAAIGLPGGFFTALCCVLLVT
jgi:hypothetical protein